MTKYAATPLPLVGVLLLALALRVWGITWGLPSATHYFSYHPDESVVLETASVTMNVFAGHLLPHFYNYGSLQLYLVCFANTGAALFGNVEIVPKSFSAWYPQWAKMYLIGRCLTVGMGIGTVWATFAIGARLWDRRAGLIAGLLLAVTPLHALHSHFLTVDVPATLWVVLSLLWSVRLATDDPKPLRAALLAGIFAGLAAATKYNMALAILPLLAACARPTPPQAALLPEGKGEGFKKGVFGRGLSRSSPSRFGRGAACGGVGLLASFLAFLAACPGFLLEHGDFLRDFHAEAVHVQNRDDPTFRDTGNGFAYHITHNLDAGMGLPLLLLALASVVYALHRRQRGDGLLAAFALPYYILIGLAAVRYARYTIPLLPILALWAGRMLADGSRLTSAVSGLAAAVGAIVSLATLVNAASLVAVMAGTDTRDAALSRLSANAALPQRIGFPVQPWFGTVPVSPYFPSPGLGDWQKVWQSVTPPGIKQRIVYSGTNWDLSALQAQQPDVVVLSEYDYGDPLRLHDPTAAPYLAYLARTYTSVNVYSPRLSTLNRSKSRLNLPSRDLPHDMIYPSPDIVIFTKRKGASKP